MQRGWVVSEDYRSAIAAISTTRQQRGLSQRELARRLGKPPSFINKIELLERRLDILEFVAIAQAMGMDSRELLAVVLLTLPGTARI